MGRAPSCADIHKNERPAVKRICRAAILLASATLLHGCGGKAETEEGHVRLVNATRAYSSLDLYQSSTRIVASTAAGTSSDYAGLEEETYTFYVKNAGSSSSAATLSGSVEKEAHYAVIAYATGGAMATVYVSESEDSPSSGVAKLRIFNAAASEIESVDVYLRSSACSDLGSSDTALATDVTGLQDSYSSVTAASYHVCVTAAGDKSDLRLDIPALTLGSQQIATLILTNTTGGVLLNGLLLNQQGSLTAYANTSVRMRLAADAASSGVVSAAANGTTLGTSYSSPTVGSYKLVEAGELTMTVSINGTELAATGLSASAGTDVTLLVAGSVASPAITLLSDDNTPSTSSSKPVKIRLVNGLNGIGGAAMLTVDGDVIADSVDFGAASTPVNVPASSAAAALDITYAGTSLWSASSQTLTSGKVYTMFLLGDSSGTPKGILRADH
jgi:hypothetical protein